MRWFPETREAVIRDVVARAGLSKKRPVLVKVHLFRREITFREIDIPKA